MLVKDVMTKKVITVTPETRIEEIVRLFLKHHISGVPVVDEAGRRHRRAAPVLVA